MTRRTVAYVAAAYLLAVTIPMAAHATTTAAGQKSAASAKSATAAKGGHHAAKAAAMPKIDINTASESDLAALPGMDEATAQKIIAARPFKNSSQVLSKGLVSKEEFGKIRNRITARQSSMESKAGTKPAEKTPAGSTEGSSTTK